MSAMSPSGFVGQDVSRIVQNWPGARAAQAPSTAQNQGVPMATGAPQAGGQASPVMPWVTCIAILLVIRILSHVRTG